MNDKSGHKRDWSPEAEKRREDRAIVMDFTGETGLARSFIQHRVQPAAQPKPKRGWAAQHRRAPFREFFADDPQRLEKARMRHPWYRKKLAWDKLRELLGQNEQG